MYREFKLVSIFKFLVFDGFIVEYRFLNFLVVVDFMVCFLVIFFFEVEKFGVSLFFKVVFMKACIDKYLLILML